MQDPLDHFRRQFFRWVEQHNKPSKRCPAGYQADPQALYQELLDRVPANDYLKPIGRALQDGWLTTADDGRGYFVKENAAASPPQPAVYHAGGGKIIPWWELYVQLAYYAQLRAIAERRQLTVRMEDRQMDITVWAGERMLMYVETKVTAAQAKVLLSKMRAYGESGFELDDPNKGNDPLRKAMYLFADDCRPAYFGLCAIGYEQLFKVEYGDHHRFQLIEIASPVTAPLIDASPAGGPPVRTPAEQLAAELQRKSIERGDVSQDHLWLSPGSGQTCFNAYSHSDAVDRQCLLIGVYRNGRIWSDLKATPPPMSAALAKQLGVIGIFLNLEKEFPFWRKDNATLELCEELVSPIADAILDAIAME